MEQIKLQAYLDDVDMITLIVDERFYHDENQLSIYKDKTLVDFEKHRENLYDGYYKLTLRVNEDINLREPWRITLDESIETEILSGKVVRTKSFIEQHDYQGPLGFTYTPDYTDFRLWAPLAKKVHLMLENPSGEREDHVLEYDQKGVYAIRIHQDLEAYSYYYQVYVNGGWKKVKDPYALASKANGQAAYVINIDNTYAMKHSYNNPDKRLIYEVSVRDFSADKTIAFKHPKQYLGMTESGLKTPDHHPLGFDYLKEIGISHIQLMPVYDFTGIDENKPNESYNWGYNPSQYFVPEGSYASDPNHPYKRINELKELIDVYHQAKIGVIMDVVYNHVDDHETFPYEILVPGYSFRLDDKDIRTNYSGCGNDLDGSKPMIRKLIIDSLVHWVKFYGMDGFRFDLMGLIDYNTMNEAEKALKNIREDIIIYGEGWRIDHNSKLAHMFNQKVSKTIGFFNDQFRDSIKGSTFNVLEKGFALGNMQMKASVHQLMTSQGLVRPNQSINYIECHDNHTFFDKAMTILDNPYQTHKYQLLGTILTILAPGTPFLHLGQLFYRSKSFVENSYNAGDGVNQIHWADIDQAWEDIQILKDIIQIRQKIGNYQVKNIQWYPSGFSVCMDHYQVFFMVQEDAIAVSKDHQVHLITSPIDVQEKVYVLKEIGVYIFERKSLC
jgi:pullulanase